MIETPKRGAAAKKALSPTKSAFLFAAEILK